ncbi:magnesium transporter MRS2-I [Artemisia annua]|uniref:Magnesium transporter MRS2-I n=1 Tax=Artemisia annua TaxID=35608 RepID=A0A2U1LWS8_ARTAN|nr:magnesium transporter MRS2-I [Artemisia annua]
MEFVVQDIRGNEVLLRDPSDDNVITVVEELRRRLPVINANQGELGGQMMLKLAKKMSPFEFGALEVFLEAICSFHAARTTELETDAYPALDELTSKTAYDLIVRASYDLIVRASYAASYLFESVLILLYIMAVLLRDPSDDNVITVVEELRRRLPVINANQGELGGQMMLKLAKKMSPFEFGALEVFLEAICSFHAARTTELETDAYPALDELTSKTAYDLIVRASYDLIVRASYAASYLFESIISRNLDQVRKLKSAMTRLTARVQKA